MTLKKYLITMIIATILCWSGWIFVLFNINPEITTLPGFVLFYLSLFLAILGTGSIVGFVVRFIALKRGLAFRLVVDAFRQSFFFSFLIISSLFLLSRGLFTWLNLFFLVLALSVLEFLLISRK